MRRLPKKSPVSLKNGKDLNMGVMRVVSTWCVSVCYLNMFKIKMYNRFSRMSLPLYIQWEQHDLYSVAVLLFSLRVP